MDPKHAGRRRRARRAVRRAHACALRQTLWPPRCWPRRSQLAAERFLLLSLLEEPLP
jgi:hypothetical protein